MEFKTAAQQSCYEKITPWVKELFEGTLTPEYPIPLLIVSMGSASAMVEICSWGDDTTIRTWSYVVTGAELTDDLMRFLLRLNVEIEFGAFGIDDDGDIRFEHALVGSTCDKNELQASVKAVLEAADRYDDEIVRRWGGRRAVDRIIWGLTANGNSLNHQLS